MTAIHLIHRGTESVYCGIKSANTSVHPAAATCKRCAKAYTAEQRALDTDAQYVLDHADTMTEKATNQAAKRLVVEVEPTAPVATRCECSVYYYTIGAKVCTTACTKAPSGKKSRFAQGHDQKLVSLRKAAAAAGAEIKRWGE